jgi:hypothetical protein
MIRGEDRHFCKSQGMDLQQFLEKLPQQYQDWGSPLMSPISEQLTLLSPKNASYPDRNLFPLLNSNSHFETILRCFSDLEIR